ncbi:MAG: alpha/beta hydrolase [Alphaproteobacteria bacterium]|nr:alpha/beta hydrolase [Alphaproteobacteria bacterium]
MPQAPTPATPNWLNRRFGRIAYHRSEGKSPGVMFLGGFMSDMTGIKATALERHCRETGRAFLRFDYRGHGQSDGRFEDGTIGSWLEDATAVFDELTSARQILVGSSMGGWIAVLLARARPERVHALIGLAAAPDFTEDLSKSGLDSKAREALERDGVAYLPSDYGDRPYPITRALIEDGRSHLVLRSTIGFSRPVHLIQGMRDPDVPWVTALRLAECLESQSVVVTLVKDGDHRLSRPEDLARLFDAVDAMAAAPD